MGSCVAKTLQFCVLDWKATKARKVEQFLVVPEIDVKPPPLSLLFLSFPRKTECPKTPNSVTIFGKLVTTIEFFKLRPNQFLLEYYNLHFSNFLSYTLEMFQSYC